MELFLEGKKICLITKEIWYIFLAKTRSVFAYSKFENFYIPLTKLNVVSFEQLGPGLLFIYFYFIYFVSGSCQRRKI